MAAARRRRFDRSLFVDAFVFGALLFVFAATPSRVAAQQVEAPPSEEMVVNLAAGRVIVAVVKDAILIGTIENPIEVQTHPPIPVAIGTFRVEVLLGAVDWESPSSQIQLARLDRELSRIRGRAPSAPSLGGEGRSTGEAVDLEGIGQALFERFNEVTKDVHGKLDLPPGEPLAQLIVADFARDYGPEVWQLTFEVKQEMQREDYFDTHVTRPAYLQLYPPEKGKPHELVEFQYPPENPLPTLMDLLRKKDPRFEKLRSSDTKMAQVAAMLDGGQSNKIAPDDAVQFLRAALDILTPPKARQTLAIITLTDGFHWIVQPPAEPKPAPQPGEKDRPPDAPTLLGPPR